MFWKERILLVIALFVIGTSDSTNTSNSEDKKVTVRFYGEAQCPFCRKFVTEVWQPIWSDLELRKFIDYDFIPWGNAYFATEKCGSGPYSAQERGCWYQNCIESSNDSDECFAGEVVYQHGLKEGQTDIYESCVKDLFGLEDAVAFTHCVEGPNMDHIIDAEALMRKCLVKTQDANIIQDCLEKRGRDIEISNAKQTPTHPGVPYVIVDGDPVDDMMKIKEIICKTLENKNGVDPFPKACQDRNTSPQSRLRVVRCI